MAVSSSNPAVVQPDVPSLPSVIDPEPQIAPSTPVASSPQQIMIRRRVLKAAKTRALKTYEGFSQERADSLAPSNCFVRLRISRQRLKHLGVPVTRTRWEDKVLGHKSDLTSDSIGQRHEPKEVDTVSTESHDVVKSPDVKNRREDKDQFHEEDNKADDNSRSLANQGGTPSYTVSIGLETGCITLGPPNFKSNFNENSAITKNHLQQSTLESSTCLSQPATNAQLTTEGIVTYEHDAYLKTPDVSRNTQSEAIKSILKTEFEESKPAVGQQTASSTPNECRVSCSTPCTQSRIITGDGSDNQNQQLRDRPTLNTSPTTSIDPFQTLQTNCFTNSDSATFSTAVPRLKLIISEPNYQQPLNSCNNDLEVPHHSLHDIDMAPVRDPNNVDTSLKDAIQKLYEVQSQVHGFVPETQPLIVEKMTELARSLDHLQTITSPTLSPNNPIHKNRIAPEVIDYVDDSRNPDIYNREFVELVQRGNAVMNGKQKAFADFSEIFANALKDGMPELSSQVDKVLKNAKAGSGELSKTGQDETNGANRTNGKSHVRRDVEAAANGS